MGGCKKRYRNYELSGDVGLKLGLSMVKFCYGQLYCMLESVWPDVAKFHHFGKYLC